MNAIRRAARAAALSLLLAACSSSGGGDGPGPGSTGAITAVAGIDRAVDKGAPATLDGSASFHATARPLAYLWTMLSRPAGSQASVGNPISAVAAFTPDLSGPYLLRLQVTDGVETDLDEVTITAVNTAPLASAGADREGSRGLPTTLSGAASHDPNGDPLAWQWTLVSAPAGSTAALTGATTASPTLAPDLFGAYVLRLSVTDGELTATDEVTVTVRNHPPVADAGADLESNAGAVLPLSGVASRDPDGDAIQCAWTLAARPAASVAALSGADTCTPMVAFDVEGTYAFSLVAGDGELDSAPDLVQVTVHRAVWRLGHGVVDAEYSRALDRLVTVGASPSRLYVADPVTQTEVSVALAATPTAVGLSPDGLTAAVGHNGSVSYVVLSPGTPVVEKVMPTTADVLDVVLAGNGWIYAFPRVDQWSEIHCLRIATGAEALSASWSIYAGTRARLHPSGTKIYGADNGLSPSDIERYDISGGTAVYRYDSPYHGDYPMCGDLWFSEDGARIFTACGRTFAASDTQGTTAGADMTYTGALDPVASVRWLDHSSAAGLIMAVPASQPYAYPPQPAADAELRLYSPDGLGQLEVVPLPRFAAGGRGFLTHGRFAFFSADGSRRVVVGNVDASAALLPADVVITY